MQRNKPEDDDDGGEDRGRLDVFLKRRFLVFLAALGMCSVIAYVAFAVLISGQDRLASLINDVGRQRMLAMRIAATALRLPMAEDATVAARWRSDLVRDLTLMEDVFARLPAQAAEGRLDDVVALYMTTPPYRLDQTFATFQKHVRALTDTMAAPPDSDHINAIVAMAHGDLLTGVEALVSALEGRGKAMVLSVQVLAVAGEGGYLLLLLGLGARILWPLSRHVQQNLRHVLDLEQFQKSIVDGLGDGLILLRRDGRIGKPLNPAAAAMFGLEAGLDMLLSLHIPDLVEVARDHDQAAQWNRREVDGLRADGTPMHLEVTLCPVAQRRTVAVVRDVTEVRENAARVRSFYHVLEQAPVSVVITDDRGVIEYVNPQMCRSTGYTPEEVIGQTPRLFKSGQTPADIYRNLWSALRQGRQWRCEILNKRKNGELFWEFQAISPLRDSRGRITQFLAVKEDITQQKEWQRSLVQAMENARRASQAKSDFLAGMSHELRTPLNAVIGYSELAMLQPWGPIGDPRYRDYLVAVNDSGRHLLQLINDLLDLSKVEAERLELCEDEIDLGVLLDQTDVLVREQAGKSGVVLRRVVPDPVPGLHGDALRLKQVLLNLLSNAIKFSPRGSSVTVTVEAMPGDDLQIAVADHGRGIREADLLRVMEPFGQADDPMVRQEVGTGLGLPLSRKLVELHGGTLEITSTFGVGTTVTVSLPASRVIVRSDVLPKAAAGR